MLEIDATVMGVRTKDPVKMQLDIKDPKSFVKILETLTKTSASIISGKITKAEADESSKITTEEKKNTDTIAAKTQEAKAAAGV
jgi:hypothetical protein